MGMWLHNLAAPPTNSATPFWVWLHFGFILASFWPHLRLTLSDLVRALARALTRALARALARNFLPPPLIMGESPGSLSRPPDETVVSKQKRRSRNA